MKSVNETIDIVKESSNPFGNQDAAEAIKWVKNNCSKDLYDELHDMMYMDSGFKVNRLICVLVEMIKELKR